MKDDLPLGMTITPLGWPMMAQAYIDFALFASAQEDFVFEFERDTGVKYFSPQTTLDKMIDEETGREKFLLSAFLDWLTVNHWGEA